MPKVIAAWGIDIGQCGLKALRCHRDPADPKKVIGDAFDYIEYPKILSQPEADPPALVKEALAVFLSRNTVKGDRVAISVSGSSGLTRFIKLPPVETKKIPDIVRYEANQQIPFDLKDVIWAYQRMYGGSEEEGFALETEVGIFAMKRDQVYQALAPMREAGIDVEIVQLTPLALYNYIVFDRLGEMGPEDEFDPTDPPESVMALSLGTETTDLVITNGFRVWQRNIPIGGSHFTKALTKELKLTYAKAEHLKRNATQAEDPKAVYQAMRPVFKDLLTEVQRSIGFFNSLDKTAKIGRVVTLGNSMKLPGLKRYLSQNLGFEVTEVDSLPSLGGPAVSAAPAFKNNVLCFGVAYGLALQGLGLGRLSTNLVPVEMVRERMIADKKPLTLASTVVLTLGALAACLAMWWPWSQVQFDENKSWKEVSKSAKDVDGESQRLIDSFKNATVSYTALRANGDDLVSRLDRRMHWSDMLLAVNQCMPHTTPDKQPLDLGAREEIHLLDLRTQRVDNLSQWVTPDVRASYNRTQQVPPPAAGGRPPIGAPQAPSGPGYVVQIRAYHLHNLAPADAGADFVRRTLLASLDKGMVKVPSADGKKLLDVSTRDLGISYPILRGDPPPTQVEVTNPAALSDPEHPDRKPNPDAPRTITLFRYEFIAQFAWQPRTPPARTASRVAALSPRQIMPAGEQPATNVLAVSQWPAVQNADEQTLARQNSN